MVCLGKMSLYLSLGLELSLGLRQLLKLLLLLLAELLLLTLLLLLEEQLLLVVLLLQLLKGSRSLISVTAVIVGSINLIGVGLEDRGG